LTRQRDIESAGAAAARRRTVDMQGMLAQRGLLAGELDLVVCLFVAVCVLMMMMLLLLLLLL
jgi:hypothetical protein